MNLIAIAALIIIGLCAVVLAMLFAAPEASARQHMIAGSCVAFAVLCFIGAAYLARHG